MENLNRTPRTDRFIDELPPLRIPQEVAVQHLDLVLSIREHMVAYANFARGLERELMMSTPKEWKE